MPGLPERDVRVRRADVLSERDAVRARAVRRGDVQEGWGLPGWGGVRQRGVRVSSWLLPVRGSGGDLLSGAQVLLWAVLSGWVALHLGRVLLRRWAAAVWECVLFVGHGVLEQRVLPARPHGLRGDVLRHGAGVLERGVLYERACRLRRDLLPEHGTGLLEWDVLPAGRAGMQYGHGLLFGVVLQQRLLCDR
jgi:hypothetical protein